MMTSKDFLKAFGGEILEFSGYVEGGFYYSKSCDDQEWMVTVTPISTEGMKLDPAATLNTLAATNSSVYVEACKNDVKIFEGEVGQNLRGSLVLISNPDIAPKRGGALSVI